MPRPMPGLVAVPLGDFLLRCNRLFRADLGYMSAVLLKIVAESGEQLLAVVGEELRVERTTRNRHVSHAAVEQILSAQLGVT
jgi:hypothetical protein